ncbi:MAG: hypothetical protein PUC65_13890 [Clostridiales bacterium]|nr:hypothetical protein [Clostridiales bacterium]
MVLALECVIACILFGFGIVISVIKNRTFWLEEYSPAVQERFLKCNPEFVQKPKGQRNGIRIVEKIIVCILFLMILAGMVWFAGADSFMKGAAYSYIIWFVVNLFDALVLDLGILMYWKKVRLPGTEDMDAEYTSNKKKHLMDGIYGMLIGLPVCLLVGLVSTLF